MNAVDSLPLLLNLPIDPEAREEALLFHVLQLQHRVSGLVRDNSLLREQVGLLKVRIQCLQETSMATAPADNVATVQPVVQPVITPAKPTPPAPRGRPKQEPHLKLNRELSMQMAIRHAIRAGHTLDEICAFLQVKPRQVRTVQPLINTPLKEWPQ